MYYKPFLNLKRKHPIFYNGWKDIEETRDGHVYYNQSVIKKMQQHRENLIMGVERYSWRRILGISDTKSSSESESESASINLRHKHKLNGHGRD